MAIIKTQDEIERMRESARILSIGVATILDVVEPGISSLELDDIFVRTIRAEGGEPAFLGYGGFPNSICASPNTEVVHGIPNDTPLEEGTIIGLDCGVIWEGYHSDMARTVAVGEISEEAQTLIDVTEHSLNLGIEQLVPGNTIGDIGFAIQQYIEPFGYGIVHALVGHGIGEELHEKPAVPNFGKQGRGQRLEAGMVLAVEPMINIGTPEVLFDKEDGWTVTTADDTLSAHFEDTILITEEGPEILTRPE